MAVTGGQPTTVYVAVYVVVTFGVTVIVLPFCPPGDQVKVPPGTVDVAVSVAGWPAQIVALFTEITGDGFMVTVTGVNAEGQP